MGPKEDNASVSKSNVVTMEDKLNLIKSEGQPVCSSFGRQFQSLCWLHKQACARHRRILLAYFGPCVAKQIRCKGSESEQFPFRLLDWFLHLREMETEGHINPSSSPANLTHPNRLDLAQWQFSDLDQNDNGELNKQELRVLRLRLMPLEHCSNGFFRSCDKDHNKVLSLDEWTACLVGQSEHWYEVFMSEKMGPRTGGQESIEE
uniref:SPARC-like n=1 Tax=Myxine glutinosa TaxID=7769 RepID=UPI00358ED01B